MAWNFRRRVKILPGVTLNVGKTGVSTSVGVKGAQMTFGKNGRRTTVGLPGTGLSHSVVETRQSGEELQPIPVGFRASPLYKIGKGLVIAALAIAGALTVFFGALMLSGGKKKPKRRR